MSQDQGTPFPQALQAEQALLGGLMLDHQQIPEIADVLQPGDFFREAHERLFKLIVELGSRADMVGIYQRLVSPTVDAEDYGGVAYVTGLPEQVPTTENLGYYAELIRETALRRRLLLAADRLRQHAQEGREIEDLAGEVDALRALVVGGHGHDKLQDVDGVAMDTYEELVALQEAQNRGEEPGILSGIDDLDDAIRFDIGDMVVIGARPSMGKSAFALELLQRYAERGIPCLLVSLEMHAQQLGRRVLSRRSRVFMTKLVKPDLRRHDFDAIEHAMEDRAGLPLLFGNCPGANIRTIRRLVRKAKIQHPDLRVVAVDYMQLMAGERRSQDNRENVVAAISRDLKLLALEQQVVVLALSQLNRGVESRQDKRPMMADLRESGAIEQDADVILFLYRDEVYNDETPERGILEVLLAKARQGRAPATVKLRFDGAVQQIGPVPAPPQVVHYTPTRPHWTEEDA